MRFHSGAPRSPGNRRRRRLLPCLLQLERRTVPFVAFPQIAGIALDSSGDVFVSYNDFTLGAGQQQAIAEVDPNGFLTSASVFHTTGANAFPGALAIVGASDSVPNASTGEILELQPDGQLNAFNPSTGAGTTADNLASYTANASSVFDVQTGGDVNLSSTINLSNATYGDFGVYGNALVISAESNNWDFVLRLAYGAGGCGHRSGRFAGQHRAIDRTRGRCRRLAGDGPDHASLPPEWVHHGDRCPGRIQSLL